MRICFGVCFRYLLNKEEMQVSLQKFCLIRKLYFCGRFSLGSDLHCHALVAVIGGEEEHFEDFGESNSASELLLANQEDGRAAPEGEGDPEPHPHAGSPVHRPPMLLSPRYRCT